MLHIQTPEETAKLIIFLQQMPVFNIESLTKMVESDSYISLDIKGYRGVIAPSVSNALKPYLLDAIQSHMDSDIEDKYHSYEKEYDLFAEKHNKLRRKLERNLTNSDDVYECEEIKVQHKAISHIEAQMDAIREPVIEALNKTYPGILSHQTSVSLNLYDYESFHNHVDMDIERQTESGLSCWFSEEDVNAAYSEVSRLKSTQKDLQKSICEYIETQDQEGLQPGVLLIMRELYLLMGRSKPLTELVFTSEDMSVSRIGGALSKSSIDTLLNEGEQSVILSFVNKTLLDLHPEWVDCDAEQSNDSMGMAQ